MDRKIAEQIVAAAHDLDILAELYEDYSGRFMYGRTTAAVVLSRPVQLAAAAAQAVFVAMDSDQDVDDLIQAVCLLRQDDMGKDLIFY